MYPIQYPAFNRRNFGRALAAPFVGGFARDYPRHAYRSGQYFAKTMADTANRAISYVGPAASKNATYFSASSGGPVSGRYYKNRRYRRKPRKTRRKARRTRRRYRKSSSDKESICIWRDINSGQLSCEANQCSYGQLHLLNRTGIENAIDGAQILDPAAGTLAKVTVDLTSIDGLKTKILSAATIVNFRNNAQTPANLKVYYCSYKKRNASGLTTLFEDGLENRGITANELTDIRFDIYDSSTFKEYVKVFKTKVYRLNGGDEILIKLRRKKPLMYDPDEFDQHANSEYVPYMSQSFFFRIEGVVSHDDTTTTNVGTCDCTLDYTVRYHVKFSASGGTQLSSLITGANSLDAQAVNPKVVVDPVSEVAETL